jgi:hypothetical protein
LSSAVAEQASSDFTIHDPNVLARDHDDYSVLAPTAPHIIGSSATSGGAVDTVEFLMQGQREVVIASDTSASAGISVDNFVLFQIGMNGTNSYYGEGTGDSLTYVNSSVPGDDGYIHVNGQDLTNFLVGASGGTASFNPTDFSSYLKLNTPISFKSEALDCGESGGVSDIYLLFR